MAVILVADDEPSIRMLFKGFLETMGHTVHVADNGKEAINLFEKLLPEVAFFDITMPELNGLTAAKRLLHSYPNANIVIITAMGYKEMVNKAVAEGIRYFIVKPFELETITKLLQKILGPRAIVISEPSSES